MTSGHEILISFQASLTTSCSQKQKPKCLTHIIHVTVILIAVIMLHPCLSIVF